MAEQGHDNPLVDHLMKAIKEAGVDLETAKKSELGRPTYDLFKVALYRTTDTGKNVWITKKTYEKIKNYSIRLRFGKKLIFQN